MIGRMAWSVGVVMMVLVGMASARNTRQPAVAWMTDFEKAKAVAAKENRPIFLLFTGSDWCEVCQILEENVLSKREFAEFTQGRMVMVKIDFEEPPIQKKNKSKKKVSPELQAKIDLALKFDVNVGQENKRGLNGYPSVFLVSPTGEKLSEVNANINAANAGVGPFLKELSGKVEKAQEKIKQK